MAPTPPRPDRIASFETGAGFYDWLAAHHADEPELWLRLYRKASGIASLTYGEALDAALCWGWVDSSKRGYDEVSFLQRFSPRKKDSVWSQINRDHVARLIAENRMQPPGLACVETAKANGRWESAYAAQSQMEMPADLLAAIAADPAAQATFDGLNRQNRYALAFRLAKLKTEKARIRKIGEFVAMLARGEVFYPGTGNKTP